MLWVMRMKMKASAPNTRKVALVELAVVVAARKRGFIWTE